MESASSGWAGEGRRVGAAFEGHYQATFSPPLSLYKPPSQVNVVTWCGVTRRVSEQELLNAHNTPQNTFESLISYTLQITLADGLVQNLLDSIFQNFVRALWCFTRPNWYQLDPPAPVPVIYG
jgi:hypothetical protein